MKFLALLLSLLLLQTNAEATHQLHALTYSNKKHTGLKNLFRSAKTYGVPLEVLGIPSADYAGPDLPFKGTMDKFVHLNRYLDQQMIADDDLVLFLDAFDTLFLTGPETIVERFLEFNAPIVMGAERHCWPLHSLSDRYPKAPTSHRYLNSGFFIGYAGEIKQMVKDVLNTKLPKDIQVKKPNGDQIRVTCYYLDSLKNGTSRIVLDHANRLVLDTTSKMSADEMAIIPSPLRLVVKETGNTPCVFHANGSNMRCYTFVYTSFFGK